MRRKLITLQVMPESATGWVNVLWKTRERGGDRIGLIITDVLKGLHGYG